VKLRKLEKTLQKKKGVKNHTLFSPFQKVAEDERFTGNGLI